MAKLPASPLAPAAGKATPAPKKPSSALPPIITAQAKPMAKPAPAVKKATTPTKAMLTAYGTTC